MAKTILVIGAVMSALAVAIGAFGAHGLEGRVSERMLDNYQTGVQYHMFHALGMIAVGIVGTISGGSSMVSWSGWLMLFGIIVFSGSLYIMALTGMTWLGAITPIGGVSFIVGWILLTLAVMKM
ncbi:uncharacterized membrane protein YgdD (TMEM256/DUF423 family) [Geomicrobium halophilum]|uniref:Uncharacterized membrane protein YgdD (TMEM256/DUF423 family) n=1 Tax=Geomicrobium halophilum TaxID=549000 RepID=A0A841Q0A1_9BACL|nr:DUF423 domain-containing protein [Geomicrobium halophilum]MBB6450555.1 uncharacterized membrane protein YgdD (TMEM256/DUF423 family) [Geomicrobium halophilum]